MARPLRVEIGVSHVIVAEDDKEMRQLVAEVLRKDGHEVEEADDGGRLLVKLAQSFELDPTLSLIDVVVSDLRMPVCNGLELLEQLAEARWDVPFLLVTAFADPVIRRRAEGLGAEVLDKPLSPDDLIAAVKRLARRRRRPS
jgi:CheY-like chemotaxis protein